MRKIRLEGSNLAFVSEFFADQIFTLVCVFCFTCRHERAVDFLIEAGWKAAFVEIDIASEEFLSGT